MSISSVFNLSKNKFRLLPIIFIVQMVVYYSSFSYSQVPGFYWVKCLGGNNSSFGKSIVVDPSGNVFTTGYFKGNIDLDPGLGAFMINSLGEDDGYISKLDRNGDFVWGKQIGGTDWDQAVAITLDALNNVYVTGHFGGTANFGSTSLTATGPRDIFVCKLDDQGNFLWAKGMSGDDMNAPYAIATDSQNNVVITGGFKGTVDFDPGAGTFSLTSFGGEDIFVAKLDPSGNFMWAKQMGGTGSEWAAGITVDGSDNILLTGNFKETSDFSGVSLSTDESMDVFVCKLANDGTQLWVKQFEGVVTGTSAGASEGAPPVSVGSYGIGKGIVTDNSGNVYTTGYYKGNVDFDPSSSGTFFIPSVDSVHEDVFVSKLNSQGDFVWAKALGSVQRNQAWAIDVNVLGNVYITGRFAGTLDFDPSPSGTYNLTSGFIGGSDAFIGVLDNNGNFVWAGQFIGSTANINIGWSIKADDLGRIYTTGYFGVTVNFDPGVNDYFMSTQQPAFNNPNVFVHKIADPLIASFTASNNSICEGDSITFTDQSTGMVILSWDWTFNGGLPASASTQGPHTVTFNTAGTYNISLEIEDDLGDTDDTTIVITVNPKPIFTVSSTNPSCGNPDGEIIVTPGSGANITTYSIDNGTTTQTGGDFPNLDAGNYIVHVVGNNGCEAIQPVSLSNSGAPNIDDIDVTQASCTANDGTITITASGGTGTLEYSIDNGTNFQIDNGFFTGLGAGTYNIVVKDANGCATTGTATINQTNAPDLILVSSDNVTCNGDDDGSIEVGATGGTGTYTYSWSPNVSTSANATDLLAGDYTITVTDASGCTDELQVTISEPDAIKIIETITDEDCGLDNGEIALNVTGGSGNYTYTWNPNVSSTNQATDLSVGNYEVTVSDDNGCSQTVSYDVIQGNSFYIEVVPIETTILQGASVDLHLFIDPNITVDNIIWTPSEGLSCADCKDPVATPEDSIIYIVTVTDENGCTSKDSVKINVISPCADIFVPNTFSPNLDGLNDLQCVLGECIVALDFAIFNRWGEPIFHTLDQEECWDGTFRGKLVQSGVYVYKLTATLENGVKFEDSGTMTVVR